VTKARVLLVHLTKNHPLPDGNKRAAYLAMIDFLARNGRQFVAADVDATIDMMVKIAGSQVEPAEVETGSGNKSTELLLVDGEARIACQRGSG
jgi:death-on-curing family protein